MEIVYHNNFVKNFKKRFGGNQDVKKKYAQKLKLFITDPSHPLLKDHGLRGEKIELRAFWVTGDIRVVYKRIKKIVYFLDIGSHNQVY